jgi:hypothetical protein
MKRRPGTRFIAAMPEGASWTVWNGKIIVCHPDGPPYIQHWDGTKEEIKPLKAASTNKPPASSSS